MVKKLWSISALAVELGRDRRTVATFLRGVPPDGQINGHPAWHLQTALTALGQSGETAAPNPLPTGFGVLNQVKDPLHQGVLATILGLVYTVGPTVADLAVTAGASMRVAFTLHNMMILHFAGETEELCGSIGIDPRPNAARGGIFNLGALQPTNWKTLAEKAGEPVDVEAWQEWFHERSQGSPAAPAESNGGYPT